MLRLEGLQKLKEIGMELVRVWSFWHEGGTLLTLPYRWRRHLRSRSALATGNILIPIPFAKGSMT